MSISNISWTDRVWNPIVGCTHPSSGCDNCYARDLHNKRHKAFKNGKMQNCPQYAKPFNEIQFIEKRLEIPLKRKKPTTYFVNSVSDLLHENLKIEQIARVFHAMELCKQHTFIILTKRPDRLKYFLDMYALTCEDFPNIYFGVSVEDQKSFDERVPILLETPVVNKILSIEPLVGEIDMAKNFNSNLMSKMFRELSCVIVGGESGSHARKCEISWIQKVVGTCWYYKIPLFLKQLGSVQDKMEKLSDKKGSANGFHFDERRYDLEKYTDLNNLPWDLEATK